MKFNKVCDICGTPFVSTVHNAKYCCPECKSIGKKTKHKAFMEDTKSAHSPELMDDIMNDVQEPFRNTSRLIQNNTMARKLGVDYGTYIAMLEGRLPMPRIMGVGR